jgi:hypothetical protein
MSEMAALLLFFQDMSRTPPFALGEDINRGGWEDHKEHLTRRNLVCFCLATTPNRALWLVLSAFGIDWEDQERLKQDACVAYQ